MVDCEGISLGSSCAKLPHSRSAEISKTPPPGAGPKGGGKMLAIRVHMLDDNVTLFQVQAKALGRVLFDQVCKQLHLLEADYFGLEYKDSAGTRYWLDLEKPLSRQVGLSMVEPLVHFCVKFYTPDPAQLEEEFTRYLFCLQIKRDLAQGHMQCNDNTAALMASYIVQAECGDYSSDDYPDHSYLSSYKFVQHQNADLEKKIMENHKKHVGQSPAEADLNLLETARRCELYGMKMHPVKDHEGVPLNLAVAHMGIVVFQNYMKIYTFSWAKVRKISFKRKRFLIKLHPDGYGYYKDVVEFFFESRNECKNLWKKCVENHGFFRCSSIKRVPRQRTRVLSRGSSFRYSGKTQKQIVEFVRENYVKRQNFQRNCSLTRSQSFRQSSSVHSSVATNVGGSISAHPLIPLGECSIVSASCGSMVLAGVEEASQSRTFLGKTTTTGPTTTRTNQMTPAQERTSLETGSRTICTTISTTTNTTSSPINNRLATGSGNNSNTSHPLTTSVTGHPSYNTTSSQTDLLVDADREPEECYYSWQRSASAKELRKQDSAGSNQFEPSPRRPCNRSFIIAGVRSPSFERDPPPEPKVYSFSYPGGTASTSSLLSVSGDSIGGGNDGGLGVGAGSSVLVIDTGSSHDDLSHDSYELLARSVSDEDDDNDEELFTMDDVDPAVGRYVEPRYRDMGFNEFNERCKEGIARFRRQLEFTEFENTKTRAGQVIGYAPHNESEMFPYYYPVERAKSEPFVSSDFWRVARQHRKLFHQKSFDYTPSESMDSADSNASKSAADIPYTLHKRQRMNGTALQPKISTLEKTQFDIECRSPVSPQRTIPTEVQNRRRTSDLLDSQDSGLSMSAGGPDSSVDELDIQAKPVHRILKPSLAKVSSEEGTISARPARSSILSRSGKALSADSGVLRKASSLERAGVEIIKIPSEDGEGIVICSTDDSKDVSVDTTDPDVIIVEYHTKRKRAFQKRSSSGGALVDKRANSAAGKQWKSESSSSFEFPVPAVTGSLEFRRERFSKELKTSIEGKVVRETREEREIKKQKSEELERKIAAETELRKQKSEELPKRQLSIGLSDDREQRRREAIEALKKEHDELNKIEVARDDDEEDKKIEVVEETKRNPKLVPKAVVQKQEKVVSIEVNPAEDGSSPSEKVTMEVPVEINASERQLSYCICGHSPDKPKMDSITEDEKPEEPDPPPSPPPLPVPPLPVKLTSPELVWKKLGDLPPIAKRDRSPVLFARLGFSDGSVFPATHQQSPGSSRRSKSLDAPVVSLHRLPPVTSFSSKDDTVDDEGDKMEEKPILLPGTSPAARPAKASVIEEEDASNLVIQDSNEFVAVLTPEPDLLAQALQVQSPPEVLQLSSTLGSPVSFLTCEISSPPSTHLHVEDQDLTEVVPFTPPPPQKFDDEQKVPDSFRFSHHDEDDDCEIHRVEGDEDDDDSYNNDVFVDQGSEDQGFEQDPQPERRPSTRQERLDSFKNTKSYSVDIWTSEENETNAAADSGKIETKHDNEPDKTVDEKTDVSLPQPEEITALPADLASLCERFPPDPLAPVNAFPAKRSFDDDVSSCSSSAMLRPRSSVKPFSLESSGSSSLEEGLFPPDDSSHFADEEEGSSNSARDEYQGFGYSMSGAEIVMSGYSGGALGLSRTLSRISERSTTSEQDRSDFDDDVSSTKPSSRSMSAEDESLVSSDRQPSLSSDPASSSVSNYRGGEEDEAPLPPLPPEPTDGPPPPPLAFALPPPLLLHPTGGDDDWPSPPNSSFDTPVISGHVQTFFMEHLRPDEATKVTLRYDGEHSSSDSEYENKTLQEDDIPEDSSMKENTLKVQGAKKYRHGNSSDTSLGSSTTTATTVRHCSSSTVFFPTSASMAPPDDSSLAEFGSSLSTEMLSSSRKNSDDSGCFRRRSYATPQRSFDDYDSPYSESADEAPRLSAGARARTYTNLPSPTGRKTPKAERRATSGSSPGSTAKSIARSKCYSYYSLARSPPSDGSSSSLDTADPPATPNTIPRVSKRRYRHIPPSKRRQRATVAVSAADSECRVISASSPSVVIGNSGEQEYPQSPPKTNCNNNNVATSTPKMNGGPTHNGEITSPELSPMKTVNATDTLDGEVKKKRYSSDKAYFIAKELLMTERTFKKDIEVISIRLKEQFESKPLEDAPSIWRLIHLIQPIDSVHLEQLKTIEIHVANWESRTGTQNRLADVLVGISDLLPIYSEYLNEVESVLADLSKDLTREPFESLYSNFELFKGCYLPLTLFILKPIQRVIHYSQIAERLLKHYGPQHPDFSYCEKAKLKLFDVNELAEKVLAEAENYVQLLELSRDLAGFEGTLTEGGRRFIRQGCLAKFSQKKGYQQRMFFLLSDMLLYSNLVGQSFKVHGQLPLKSLTLEEREDNPSPHSFTIYSEKRAITVSASSQEEKDKWLEDLSQAIERSKVGPNRNTSLISLKCSSSADDVSEKDKSDEGRATPQRSNTTVHVCWHRNTSVCLNDQIRAAQNQLSGYLLRKFKNSNGWQKLWVVFTNFCLFFYKTYQDSAPLASLPLLGYSVSPPAPSDEINKDFVFKLQFKNHVYFFRAESQYTFDRILVRRELSEIVHEVQIVAVEGSLTHNYVPKHNQNLPLGPHLFEKWFNIVDGSHRKRNHALGSSPFVQ